MLALFAASKLTTDNGSARKHWSEMLAVKRTFIHSTYLRHCIWLVMRGMMWPQKQSRIVGTTLVSSAIQSFFTFRQPWPRGDGTSSVHLCYVWIRPDPDVPREGARSRVRQTAINCPHQNACRKIQGREQRRLRRLEPSRRFWVFRRTSERYEGKASNISSKVFSYEYRWYIY